jgi:L-2,4-diaminobutyrate decarboxylase
MSAERSGDGAGKAAGAPASDRAPAASGPTAGGAAAAGVPGAAAAGVPGAAVGTVPGAGASAAGAAGAALRSAGRDLVERMAAYLEGVADRPVSTGRSPSELAVRFDDPLPRRGRPSGAVWDDVWDRVVGEAIHLAHPMYMGHQVAPPLPHAVLADALASLLNQSTAVWEMSPTGTPVERQVVAWMRELLGYPSGSDGTLVSGGSAANLTGLLAAREAVFPGAWRDGVAGRDGLDRAAVFAADHAHYSVERALGVMGLGSGAAVPVPERGFRLDPSALAIAIAEARARGRIPLAIVATAGSTATGLVDDLAAIADVAAGEGVWLHVDGAHGASFLASELLRGRLRGIERADSVAWDPHKMMFMPISAGAVLVRDHRHLDSAFQQSAPYLFHPRPGETRSHDIGRRTLQCSKRLDALKIWICLQHYGLDHLARLQERTVDLTALLFRKLEAADDFEPAHDPDSNILCFRYLPPGRVGAPEALDALQGRLREAYNTSGRGWITATVLGGRRVLRVTLMNPATGEQHLDALLDGLRETAGALAASGHGGHHPVATAPPLNTEQNEAR